MAGIDEAVEDLDIATAKNGGPPEVFWEDRNGDRRSFLCFRRGVYIGYVNLIPSQGRWQAVLEFHCPGKAASLPAKDAAEAKAVLLEMFDDWMSHFGYAPRS